MSSRYLLFLFLLLPGCAVTNYIFGPRQDPAVTQSLRAQFKDKRFVTLAYESITKKDLSTENNFRYEQGAQLDQALIELNIKVSDRGPIESLMEIKRLPQSFTFKGEDLNKIGKATGADILLLGYYSATVKEGVFSNTNEQKLILRAINLKTLEVINSVQADYDGDAADKQWRKLVHVLLRTK